MTVETGCGKMPRKPGAAPHQSLIGITFFLMLLAKVVGTVVATRKDQRLEGRKLLIVSPLTPEEVEAGAQAPESRRTYLVAVDTVDAGHQETVIVVQGSSARMAATCKDTPVDAAIVGIVDTIHLQK